MIFSFLLPLIAGVVQAYNPVVPVIVDQSHNVIAELEIESAGGDTLDYVDFEFSGIPASNVKSVRLMYSGTMSCVFRKSFLNQMTTSNAMRKALQNVSGGQRIWCDPAYVIEKQSVRPRKAEGGVVKVRLQAPVPLVQGKNYCYVSMEIARSGSLDLTQTFQAEVKGVSVNGKQLEINQTGTTTKRLGVLVRNAGQEGIATYRIPGLVTTKKGTLVAVFDLRRNNPNDLNDDIDVGVSRSTDGGRTWSKNIVALDKGLDGGLPEAQNGVGDPCILLDQETGWLFVMGLWSHGAGQGWSYVADGKEFPVDFSQPLMACSKDDGKTWSAPVSLFGSMKPGMVRPFQGPGRGITMSDGTLVFPFQHLKADRSFAGNSLLYSKDHGATWKLSENTCGDILTEDQVAEIEPGLLMLNSRNHNKNNPGRVVFTTSDLGTTWTEHPSSHSLQEQICQASLINVPAKGSRLITGGSVQGNNLGQDVLLFSNCDTTSSRTMMTIKASLDKGHTWPHKLLLDEGDSWGYCCMSMIDEDTVGILFESSAGQLVFQAVPLKEILAR